MALGSNLGDRLGHLRAAIEALAGCGTVAAVSSLYRTAPVGGPEQDDYLNAVAVIDIDLHLETFLGRLQQIEATEGRVRRRRWGPRTLDLDIVTAVDAAGEAIEMASAALAVPHPRAHQRRFVLEPLAEVWPEAPLGDGLTACDLLAAVAEQQVERLGDGWAPAI